MIDLEIDERGGIVLLQELHELTEAFVERVLIYPKRYEEETVEFANKYNDIFEQE